MASGRILQNARVGRADKLWPTSYVYIKRGDDKGRINISTEGKTVCEDQPQSWKSLGSVVTKEVEIGVENPSQYLPAPLKASTKRLKRNALTLLQPNITIPSPGNAIFTDTVCKFYFIWIIWTRQLLVFMASELMTFIYKLRINWWLSLTFVARLIKYLQ